MTAFRAAYADLKIVKTRGVCQVILELPLEQADAALEILGGVPRPDREVWCGVARLAKDGAVTSNPPAEQHDGSPIHKDRRPFHTLPLPTQAALLCQDERFQDWFAHQLRGHSFMPDDDREYLTTEWVRGRCMVASRKDITAGSEAAKKFLAMYERYMIETGQWTSPS
jgi:hypothetical protein